MLHFLQVCNEIIAYLDLEYYRDFSNGLRLMSVVFCTLCDCVSECVFVRFTVCLCARKRQREFLATNALVKSLRKHLRLLKATSATAHVW